MDKYTAMSISAQVHPSFLKTMPDTCDKYALNVANQLTAHRNKQLEQQKAHEQRIARMLIDSRGLWISYTWLKILSIIFTIYAILVILYVKLG